MEQVTCVRCGVELALADADIVGNGYRCAPCSAHAQHDGHDDVADNVEPETRARLARQGKRKLAAAVGLAAGLIAGPAVAAYAVAGSAAALAAAAVGLVFSANLGSGIDVSWAQWRRYRGVGELPPARAKRLPGGKD